MAALARMRVRPGAAVTVAAIALAALSLVNLHFATSPHLERAAGLVRHQALWHLVGGLVALTLSQLDYRRLLRHAHGIYLGALAALGITLALGASSHHPARWLFAAGLRVQPSEFATLALVLALARWDSDHPPKAPRTLGDLALPLAMIAAPFALVARQPDLGSAFLLALAALPILVLHPVRRTSLAALAGLAVAGSAALRWRGLYGYQLERLEAFVHPARHARDSAYQATHAADIIASGHVFGRGVTAWRALPPTFVPDAVTDLPLASWGFVTGLCGVLVLLALYATVVLGGLRIARVAVDRFGASLAVGAASIWAAHVVVNVGMTLRLLPTVGVTLPMFSYGGSGVVTAWACVGLIVSIARIEAGDEVVGMVR